MVVVETGQVALKLDGTVGGKFGNEQGPMTKFQGNPNDQPPNHGAIPKAKRQSQARNARRVVAIDSALASLESDAGGGAEI